MPFKQTTSTTTTSSGRETIKGPTKGQSRTKVASVSTTRRKLSRGEVAQGLLTTSTQLGMIGITIIVLVLTQPVGEFTKADLISFSPNYGLNNEYQGVENPLEHYNYQQFGVGVVDRLWAWIEPIEQLGRQVDGFLRTNMDLITGQPLSTQTLGIFNDNFPDRQYQLYLISRETGSNAKVFDAMTNDERDFIVDNFLALPGEEALFGFSKFHFIYYDSLDLFGGGIKWWFTEPSVIDIAIQEGYGT